LRRPRRNPPQLPSFRALFDEQVGFVWRVLQRDGVSERELEDACEEVFLTAHREREGSVQHGSVRAWIGSIASRVAERTRNQLGRARALLRPLTSERYESEPPQERPASARARMFASGPSLEARARMLAQLEGALGSEQATFAGAAAQQGAARLWMLRVALGVSVLFGGAMLQLQDGCGPRGDDAAAHAPARASAQVAGALDSAAERPAAR
jgi:DNA-directed RNA polymerase specialized sigma24 family protein